MCEFHWLKLFSEIVIKRKSNSWEVCSFQSIVWNVIKSTADCLKANNAEHCNGNWWIFNMSISREIYRCLDFGISILDEPDECIFPVQEIEVGIPTLKRRISGWFVWRGLKYCFPPQESHEKKSVCLQEETDKVKELTTMLKMLLLVPIKFILLAATLCSGRFSVLS